MAQSCDQHEAHAAPAPPFSRPFWRTWRAESALVADRLVIALLAITAFLLGCYEMADSDIWWHLRGGQWIIEHRRVPDLDPFTFGSQDVAWVDIHWLFEVLMAAAHRLAGIPAVVAVAASAGAGAVLLGATARRREWPAWLSAVCWAPALVLMSWRFDPRPEIFTLLFIAAFLAVLWRVERRPALAWLLPVFQVLWVNMQGLFVFGPILVAFYVADHGTRWLWQLRRSGANAEPDRRWWRHVGGAAAAVLLACLANPYFIQGARFPFDLYPKVAEPGNIYKEYIEELSSPARFIQKVGLHHTGSWYLPSLYLLLLVLPVSFLFPAVWRAWNTSVPRGKRPKAAPGPSPAARRAWQKAILAAVALAVFSTLTLPGQRMPGWLEAVGDAVPVVVLLASVASAAVLYRRSGTAAAVAVLGGVAVAAWMVWLRGEFSGNASGGGHQQALIPLAVAGLLACMFILRQGGSLFRLLVAGAFAYLALQAVQNSARFALVAAVLLVWNLGEWWTELTDSTAEMPMPAPRWRTGNLVAAGALALWIAAVATDGYHRWTGTNRHFALREQPWEFAHDAARFAGQPGLPEHALVYDLSQTGVFDFHNAPAHKPFMDGRLEMPARDTFETYVRIEKWLAGFDPRWRQAVRDLGDPLVLLSHAQSYNAEAALLTHPDWRCIYFDPVACVFVPRSQCGLDADFPTFDFAARHFGRSPSVAAADRPGAALRELRALHNLAVAVRHAPATAWKDRAPLALLALDRGAAAVREETDQRPAAWTLLGDSHWDLVPDRKGPPPGPDEPWDPASGLGLARATYCYRRSLELAPGNPAALRSLFAAFRARRMADAQLAVGEQLVEQGNAVPAQAAEVERLRRALASPALTRLSRGGDLAQAFDGMVRAHLPATAVRLIEEAEQRQPLTWTWPLADRVAGTYLHLGYPAEARRLWERAGPVPSESARLGRIAATYWVERDFERAAATFQDALAADPANAEAYCGLAVLRAELGRAEEALDSCRRGLGLSPTPSQRTDLTAWQEFLSPYRRQPAAGRKLGSKG